MSTCQTFFNKVYLMKDDLNDDMPNGTPKNLIPSSGVLNWDGVSKLGNKPKGDHATHFWSWIERPITQILIWKCSYTEDTMEGGRWC
jgi:hypothetical protein